MASLQAKADAVKSATTSISTCTTATVVTVKELLLSNTDTSPAPTKTASRTARTTTTTTAKTKSNAPSRPTTKKGASAHTIEELGVKEKAALATHIINVTIKSLTEASKPPPPSTPCKKEPSNADLRKATGSRTLRRSLSAPLSPLQPRTLNRVATSPNLKAKAASQPLAQSTGCLATVECARVAFACLRSIKGPVQVEDADFQLENGMSTFVGKLMSLGLQDQAWKELRILKKRLDAALSANPANSATEGGNTSQAMADMLVFEGSLPQKCLPVVTNFQIQVLRLIAMSKKPSQIESVLPVLAESNLSSPLFLLEKLAQCSSSQKQKAARQIASFSQVTLSLAPGVSSKDDHMATEARLSPSPRTSFELQVLCFKAQLRWWKMAGHQGNVDDDLLAPFSRCIRAFVRRRQPGDGPSYDIMATGFRDLVNLIQTQNLTPSRSSTSPTATIYQLLGITGHTERHYSEAQAWFQDLKELMEPEQESVIRLCSVSARLLAAALKTNTLDAAISELVQEVVDGLDGSLSGSVSELNELLESLSLARRSAVGVLVATLKEAECSEPNLLEPLKAFVLRYPRFCRRWLGAPPSRDASAKHFLQFDQRRQVLMESVSQILDSALMVVNVDIQNGTIVWQLMDDVLQDCLRLLVSVEDPTLSPARAQQLGIYHVKISSLYFSRFSQLRRDTSKSKEVTKQILGTLSRSIDAVKDQPLAQQEKAQLATKLELFADLCKAAGRSGDAVRTLRSICTNMIEEGALLKVTAALDSQPPTLAWSVDEKAETLSRTLRSIAKLDQSWNDWAFFLPEAERAAVLEHLMQISTGPATKNSPLTLNDPSVQALLRLYTLERFPLRRLRVLLHLLFQNLGDVDEMEAGRVSTDDALHHIQANSLGEDKSLARYVPHLEAYHSSLSAMASQEAPFPVSLLKEAIVSWVSMTQTCKTKGDLYERIDNPDGFLAYLESASQFASLRGENSLQLSILELSASVSKALAESANTRVILNHTLLASQHLVIGHFSEAKKTLEAIKELVEAADGVSRGHVAGFHLSQAEYYTGIGSIDEACMSLAVAKEICDGPTSSWAQSKTDATIVVCRASLLDSTLALKEGRVQEALSFIKAGVKMLSHDWSKIEARSSRATSPSNFGSSTISISDIKEKAPSTTLIGPRFWGLAFPLIRSLLHLSSVYAHIGMFQETVYYAESAQKIAESTGSPLYMAQVSAWTSAVYHRAGRLERALLLGSEAYEKMPTEVCATRVQLACQLGDLYRDIGEEEKAAELLKLAEDTTRLLGNYGNTLPSPQPSERPKVTKGPGTAAPKTVRSTRTTRARAVTTSATASRTKRRGAATNAQIAPNEPSSLPRDVYQASLLASVLLSRTLGFINQRDWSSALSSLELAKDLPKLFSTLSQEQVATSISLIGRSMEQMIQDPVFSVVQDSTISFPAVSSGSDKGSSGKLSLSPSPPRKGRAVSAKASGIPAFADALRQAQELLMDAHASALSTANSTMVHRISALLQSTVILLSATTTARSKAVASSGFATFSVDLARNVTWRREQCTLSAPLTISKAQGRASSSPVSSRRASLGLTTEMAKFQKNYVELVPKSWSVISVSLSDNQHDLCITKFQAGHSPFILRLPLERANSRDADSEVFNFEHGREEMLEIIKLANETSHSANRDFTTKGARSAWWAEREELDVRLKDLLGAIESTWLGGFRGIFSQHERRPDLLARFQKSFQQILDSSLPSRNRVRGRKTAKAPKITLDPRILDLFIGLGDPTDPDGDFDEALNDLLYFVVDILQFHGERNAYDEIDFDAMVVETHDALRGYYAAARGSERAESAHTVLVLDKALHAFPWESMPCLEGLAVSRVPSLACLRQLILESQASTMNCDDDDEELPEGHYVSARNGTYFLNPSTDLKNTQTTFQPALKSLSSWTGMINRAPEEAEFEKALSSSDILLYFGHGSGAQYVRARTIRRLEKCRPATFLMGCSSAALTEAGEFECYGPVWNYMMAGCPAVVGTLWDVTDRDIDRFAGRAFEEWGLFPRGTFKEEKRGNGKSRRVEEDDGRETDLSRDVSLAEAVARAREVCRFKYLNAAAVVLYGIPVYISREE